MFTFRIEAVWMVELRHSSIGVANFYTAGPGGKPQHRQCPRGAIRRWRCRALLPIAVLLVALLPRILLARALLLAFGLFALLPLSLLLLLACLFPLALLFLFSRLACLLLALLLLLLFLLLLLVTLLFFALLLFSAFVGLLVLSFSRLSLTRFTGMVIWVVRLPVGVAARVFRGRKWSPREFLKQRI